MSARFEIVRTIPGWHARFRARNGRIIWSTEVYERRNAAVLAVHQIAKPIISTPWEHGVMVERHGAVEVREVDDRPAVGPGRVIEWPVFHTTDLRGGDWWHDREVHWRNCTDECTELVPPVGVKVAGRFGSVTVTKALLKEQEVSRG